MAHDDRPVFGLEDGVLAGRGSLYDAEEGGNGAFRGFGGMRFKVGWGWCWAGAGLSTQREGRVWEGWLELRTAPDAVVEDEPAALASSVSGSVACPIFCIRLSRYLEVLEREYGGMHARAGSSMCKSGGRVCMDVHKVWEILH